MFPLKAKWTAKVLINLLNPVGAKVNQFEKHVRAQTILALKFLALGGDGNCTIRPLDVSEVTMVLNLNDTGKNMYIVPSTLVPSSIVPN